VVKGVSWEIDTWLAVLIKLSVGGFVKVF